MLGISPLWKLGFTVNLLAGSFIPQGTHQNLCHDVIFISIIILGTEGTERLSLQQPHWSVRQEAAARAAFPCALPFVPGHTCTLGFHGSAQGAALAL